MPRAILIVDHGSRRDEANQMLEQIANQMREQTDVPVYAAHMEMAKPTIRQAFNRAVAEGANDIFVFPYFLSPGRHSREDLPRLCAEAAAQHPNITWHCSGPIGLDNMMAELILRRVQHCDANNRDCNQCPDAKYCKPCGE